jgi:hypothetical protein
MRAILRLLPAAMLAGGSCSSRFDDVSGPAVLLEQIVEVNGLSPPSDLTGEVRAGGEQMALAWRDNSSAETGFRIDVAERPIASFADVARWTVVPADTTSWVLPCEPGAVYYVRVLAVTDTLQSPPSPTIRLATASGPPAAPSILAEGYSSSHILISWRDVAEERGYRVERSSDLGRTWSVVATVPRNSEFYDDAGLLPGSAWAYRVTAYNAFGEGVSNVAWGETLAAGVTSGTVYATGDVGAHTSIALAGAEERVAFYDATNGRTLFWSGGRVAVADASWGAGATGTDLALRSGTFAEVVTVAGTKFNISTGDARSGFTSRTLDATYARLHPKTAFHAAGAFYLYAVQWGSTLSLREWVFPSDGSFPHNDIVDVGVEQIAGLDYAVDRAADQHVALTGGDGTTLELRYLRRITLGSPAWSTWRLTSAGRPTFCSIVALPQPTGRAVPHIFYYESANGRLMHVWRDDWLVGTPWRTEVVRAEPGRRVGAYVSAAYGAGQFHLAYYDESRRDLMYTRGGPGHWTHYLMDAAGDVGTHTSIAVEENGTVHIAYRDETNGDLKIARGRP